MNISPKRVNFVSIQMSHTVASEAYHQPYVRTGYEQIMAHRTGELFAYIAEQDGRVISKTPKGIVVEYSNGEKKGVQLGRRYGKAEGSVYPHDIATQLELGDHFKAGEPIAYNTGFFEVDFMNPKNVIWKTSMLAKTALYESSQTHEDSSSISKRVSKKLTAKTTKIRSFVVEFKQGVREMLKPGTKLDPNDVLFILEDEITNEAGLFDEETLQTLKKLANRAPKAKVRGTLDKIEVYYHGAKEDMSPSLRALANQSDRELIDTAKATNQPLYTGQVNSEYRVEGVPLSLDSAEIKLYITLETSTGVGDKTVFCNQMKSVVGEVMEYDIVTESGEILDAVFGSRSIAARVVLSPYIIGTTTTLLKKIGEKAVSIYNG